MTYSYVTMWVLEWLGPATVELILSHLHPESARKWLAALLAVLLHIG